MRAIVRKGPTTTFLILYLLIASVGRADGQVPTPDPPMRPQQGLPKTAPSPTPSQTLGPPVPSTAPGEDDNPHFWDIKGRISQAFNGWLQDVITSALNAVLGFLGKIFITPKIDENARIKDLWSFSLGIADAALVVFVLAGAGIVMVSSSFEAHYSIKELLPRILGAAVAVNLSLFILGELIGWSNGLSQAFLGVATENRTNPAAMAEKIAELVLFYVNGGPFALITTLVLIVEAIVILFQYVIRVITLVLLAVSAPLLLVTHSLEQTETLARVWWKASLAALGVPVVQSILIAIAFRLFLSGDGFLGFFPGSGIVDLLFVVALLYMLIKVHSWAMSNAISGLGKSPYSKAMQRYYQWRIGSKVFKGGKAAAAGVGL
jgi:hypothetical protein